MKDGTLSADLSPALPAIIVGLGIALLWWWTNQADETQWVCRLGTGTLVYSEDEPTGDWIMDREGIVYPRDRIESCEEVEE